MFCNRRRIALSGGKGGAEAWMFLIGTLFLVASLSARGQDHANVTVDLNRTVNVLIDTSLGLPAVMFDANSFNPQSIPYLRAAGITSARYPGNRGAADLYHWSTKGATPYRGADAGFMAGESNFANLAIFAENLGQAVIVVNYGSNLDGTSGGEPVEAAAWVAYANGNATDTRTLGADSTGKDWHTVGYWATMRGQAPLAADDGYNSLRIQHPRPFGFKLWQVGDEVYNNGYYGGGHTGDPDLHGPAPSSPKDLGKLKGNPKLSPETYAENFKSFASAMKAVDPSIQVGAALTTPPDPALRNKTYWDQDGEHPDVLGWAAASWGVAWNKSMLKGACANLDFVTLEWTPASTLPPDYKTLNEADLLSTSKSQFETIVEAMLADYASNCPKGRVVPLAFAPAAIPAWPKVEHPVFKTLWVADTYAMLIESGSVNIEWNEMYGDSILSADRKTLGPVFFGLQMLHTIAHSPGDALLDVRSSSSLLAAHAASRRDGYVGLMLINKDPKESATVKVSFTNGTVGAEGRRIDYGAAQFSTGAKPVVTPFSAPGNEFTVTVPPYTITDILLPGRK